MAAKSPFPAGDATLKTRTLFSPPCAKPKKKSACRRGWSK